MLVTPIRGLRPAPQRAEEVVAPPYDVLNTAEARVRADGRPNSFLHISKPEIDLPEGTDPYDPAVYSKGAENLQRLIEDGVLMREEKPCYYIYRLRWEEHVQTGLVFGSSVAAYDINRVRKHEFTRPVKEDDRVRQITALNAQTGPVLLTYRADDAVKAIIDEAAAGAPAYDLTADDGIGHTLWVLDDDAKIEQLNQIFDATDALYIADGHHRSASASRVAKENSNESAQYFLSVAFAHDEMKILDYNRVVRDLNGLSADELLANTAAAFDLEMSAEAVRPAKPTQFGMYVNGQWYRLDVHSERVPADDPVASLDVSLLHSNLIEPLLGISDPRRDDRIDFVGGMRGLGELEKRVDSGEMEVAFSLYPTTMEALMDVADANEVMPPKSTWFEPKLADGLVSHVLD
ncbi:MAG: DUF1015 domain-containing protein [Gammaproteobacteria bacterium]|jgi:uncharacterized protein (DUF1015 family)|nr:DUF1015 domain-containing protein [Gammaproteobacteria bacterium]MBT3488737.1 DUF1015 domain-containing protein [Gammaproteobacteria bacterium]MBT3717988.1 DUF1015 domain-containing protein [Gammaproteobacteria bacterium]MBT3845440.1 DUF1015 domain-containing protein [Gammaproteobacteria bacterium]MBT3893947.1 DUF1015 domain-containing protein [Gammaproteobacteria bacterium]